MQNSKYLLEVGEADRKRLEILNKIYNPTALEFLKQSGLKPGMRVLEVGCGVGEMACALAEYVGAHGQVVAIDNSESQLKIAREKADKRGLYNIEFKLDAVESLEVFDIKFDLAYERWTLIFLNNPFHGLETMFNNLKPGGILCCEDCNIEDFGVFSYPQSPSLQFFQEVWSDISKKLNLDGSFANKLRHHFKALGCGDIKINLNQPLMLTPEEKSVVRLVLISTEKTILETNIATESMLVEMIKQAELIEHDDSVILGFIRNTLISGKK